MTTIGNFVKYIVLIALTAAISSCSDDEFNNNAKQEDLHGEVIMVPFRAKLMTQPIATKADPGSRAVDEGLASNYMPHDIWLLQFDPFGKRIGSPLYYDISAEDTPTVKIVKSSEEYKVRYIVIANTYDSSFDVLKSVSDINSLKEIYRTITKENDLQVKTGNSDGDDNFVLLMNGEGEVKTENGADHFVCTLYRNVAKTEIKINNAECSGMEILRARIRNVAPQLVYADHLLADDELTVTPKNLNYVAYEWDNLGGGIKEGESKELSCYLTRNKRGIISDNTVEWQKNNYAPDYATYIDILAKRTVDNVMFSYRFFLGANLIDDFNIIPNYLYKYEFTIEDCGVSSLDSRVYDYSPVDFATANSYIINPTYLPRSYSFPITRINEFWSDPNYVKEEVVRIGHILKDEAEWVAEVIWQDVDVPVINFIDSPDGTSKTLDDGKTLSGKGPNTRVYFETCAENYAKKGNVLIGVRLKEKSAEYLWSWHLWITDYNPDDFHGVWEDGKYVYTSAKMNGEIHRYAPVTENANSNALWGNTNPIYKDKYMMDRPLGAYSTEYSKNRNGLYYYYGRKDPIALAPLYDINGKLLTNKFTDNGSVGSAVDNGVLGHFNFQSQQVEIYQGVLHPTTAYCCSGDYNSQTKNMTDIIWSDYKCTKESKGKGIFDPCPPGWKIPEVGTFNSYSILKNENNCLTYRIAESGNDATAKCPIGGYILYSGYTPGVWTGYWYNIPSDVNNASHFWLSSGSTYGSSGNKNYSLFIRPVRE